MFRKPILSALVCLQFLATAALAQNVFVLPGANAPGSGVLAYSSLFSAIGGFSAGAGSFRILAKPDGSKYYVISSSGSQTVTVVDPSFQNPRSLGNLGQAATAAVLTPDGRKLLVVAGTLHVFDTVTDTDLTPSGVLPGVPLTDVAVSLDSTRAFVLGTLPSGQGVLYSLDLTSNSFVSAGNLPLNNITTGVAVGPNGLVYVGGVNRVYEINPSTLMLTPMGEIQTIVKAGKLAFTPDGKYLLVPNLTPGQASPTVILIDLGSHAVVTSSANIANAVLDKILVASNTLAYGYSSQTSSLYQLSIPGLAFNVPNFPGVPAISITGVGLSNEVPGGQRAVAQNLYVLSGGTAYKVDLASGQVAATAQVSTPQASVIVATNVTASTGPVTPVSLIQYGNNQGLAQGATSLPIVVRVLDVNGLPISGTQVTFASGTTGLTLQNTTVVTGADGYAATTVTAPSTSGPATVTATAGGISATFNFSVGTGTGTGGSPTGSIAIVSGQGQILFENYNTAVPGAGSPLTVKVTDSNGNPVPNAPVTFAITMGIGTLFGGSPTPDGTGAIVITDNNGVAAANFLSSSIPPASGFIQANVQASAGGTNVVVFYVTTTKSSQPANVQFLQPQAGALLTGGVGSILKGAIQVVVVSSLGQAIPNVAIRLIDPATAGGDPTSAPPSAYATCVDPTGNGVLTDATGRATCDVMFTGKIVSGQQVAAVVGNHFQGPAYNLQITAGAPAVVKVVQGDQQSARPGQQLPSAFAVQVTDAAGNVLTGAPVSFQVVTPGTVTLTNVSAATDQNGRASALGTLGNTGGTYQIKVTSGMGSATFSFTVTIAAASIQAVSGSGQTALINTAFGAPLVVKVVDSTGAPLSGVSVAFSVSNGSATVSSPTATTDASGQAQTTVTAGTSAGPITVSATASGFSASFTLTSRIPGPTSVTFVNGASFQPGISPGSIAVIQGIGLLPGVQGLVRPYTIIGPLPITLAGFSVSFNGILAPIYYVSNQNGQEQIAVQVPFEVAPGTATVVINATGGGTATLTNVPIQAVAPGVFETVYNGQKFVVAVRPDGSYVSPQNPAQRGEIDCAFATGLGQVTPTVATNSSGIANQNLVDPLDFGLNNAGVRVVSATMLPGQVGVYQICFQVPADTAPGPRQPVGLVLHDPAAGDIFAPGTFIPIQ